jgi:hypothetical protein
MSKGVYDQDLTKYKFGKLTPVKYLNTNSNGAQLWECLCDCGNIKNVLRNSLISNVTKSCGCLVKNPENKGEKVINHECPNCGSLFKVKPSRLKRTKTVCCSMVCKVELFNNNKELNPHYKNRNEIEKFFDEKYTRIKMGARKRKIPFSEQINGEFLYNLWLKQDGKCFYSNIDMILDDNKSMYYVSIDRIDSGIGYETDNVVLCSYAFNSFKFTYSVSQIFDFIDTLKNTPYN